jgi:iron complex outermembrane receptor protein/vitamin B12 transporter
VLGPQDLALRDGFAGVLRLMPGTFIVQTGQLGAQTSLFVRGGNSDSNKILLDGVSVGDLGGRFDFGPLSTTAVERAEINRGPGSSLYGADASSGVALEEERGEGRRRKLQYFPRRVGSGRCAPQARLPGRF